MDETPVASAMTPRSKQMRPTPWRQSCCVPLIAALWLLLNPLACHAWISTTATTTTRPNFHSHAILSTRRSTRRISSTIISSPTQLYQSSPASALPSNYQQVGQELMEAAAVSCGVAPHQLTIEWKPGKIIVTVRASDVVISTSPLDDDEDAVLLDDDEDDEEEFPEMEDEMVDNNDDQSPATSAVTDVVQLAKAINAALDITSGGNEIGWQIAQTHEIQVTTPIPDDDEPALTGIMWTSYQGFDVKCEYRNDKKGDDNVVKVLEGRLQERTDDYTMFNLKGRMKKIANEQINWVKLPKAKQEKNVANKKKNSNSNNTNKKKRKK